MINTKYLLMSQQEIDTAFLDACYELDLELLEYLINSPALKHNAKIHNNINNILSAICFWGTLEVLKFIIKNLDLNNITDINIKQSIEEASINGNIEIVQYLYENFPTDYDIFSPMEMSWRSAVTNGRLEVLAYILTKREDYLEQRYNEMLYAACLNDYFEIIELLLVDKNMVVTEDMKEKLHKGLGYQFLLKLIEKQRLTKKLNETSLDNDLINKILKV